MAQNGVMGMAEAAQRLGCSRQYVATLVQSGKIQASKFLNRWVIPESAIEGFTLKGHKTSPGRKGNGGN